jgi:uncharacterized protein YndB with AHSA1/START domain
MAETATTQKPSLTLVRSFKAAPEKVWQALTEPAGLSQWMGMPNAPKPPEVEADLRVGGRYRIVMHAPGGETHDVSGVYREIVPNRKLVYSWAWKSTPERESLVTLELRAAAGGTELTLKHEQFFDDEARKNHLQGWNVCLDRLEQVLS